MRRPWPTPVWKVIKECDRLSCKKPYLPVKVNQRFCSADCKVRDWVEKHPRVVISAVRVEDGKFQFTVTMDDLKKAAA